MSIVKVVVAGSTVALDAIAKVTLFKPATGKQRDESGKFLQHVEERLDTRDVSFV